MTTSPSPYTVELLQTSYAEGKTVRFIFEGVWIADIEAAALVSGLFCKSDFRSLAKAHNISATELFRKALSLAKTA